MLPRCCWFRCPGGTLFSSSPPPRRCAISPVALGGSTSTRPRSGREGWRVLAVGLFVFTTAALRRLFDSGLGLDIDTPPEWLRGAAHPHRRPRLHHHHRNVGHQSARGASPRSAASIHASLASASLRAASCPGGNARWLLHIPSTS
ncbi:hypothetical protein VPH35_104319 [Triticum aestivum]